MRTRTLVLALVAAAAVLHPAPYAAAVTGSGCQFASSTLGTGTGAYKLTPGAVWIDYFSPDGGATHYIRTWITVDSLPAIPAPPAGAASGSWKVSFTHGTYFQNDSAVNPFWRGFLKATVLSGGTVTYEAGNLVGSGDLTVASGQMFPGSPGVIRIEAKSTQLGMNVDGTYGTKSYVTLLSAETTSGSLPSLSGAQETLLDRAPASYPSQEEMTLRDNPTACDVIGGTANTTTLAAKGFTESVGVNTHLNYWPSPYRSLSPATSDPDAPVDPLNYPKVEQALLDLGIHHIRDAIPPHPGDDGRLPDDGVAGGEFIKLATAPWNVRLQAIFRPADFGTTSGHPTVGPSPGINSVVADWLDQFADADALSALEGVNEPDNNGLDSPAQVSAMQHAIAWLRDNDSKLSGLEIVGPSYLTAAGAQASAAADPDYNLVSDYANIHPYTPFLTGRPYRDFLLDYVGTIGRMTYGADPMPLRVTELGWSNSALLPPPGAGNGQVSARAAASYLPKALLTNYAHGVNRSFIYQLVDDPVLCGTHTTDPVTTTYSPVAYGLLECDYTPKPVFYTLQRLMSLLNDTGSASSGTFNYTITAPGIQSVVLDKTDGSHWMALWRDAELFDQHWYNSGASLGTFGDLYAPPTSATITFPSAQSATTYLLTSTATTTIASTTSMTVSVPSDDVLLLKL